METSHKVIPPARQGKVSRILNLWDFRCDRGLQTLPRRPATTLAPQPWAEFARRERACRAPSLVLKCLPTRPRR